MSHQSREAEPFQIFATGHGGRDLSEFLGALLLYRIDALIDIRSFPVSRHFPHFSKGRLMHSLSAIGVYYMHEGLALGGKRSPVGFDKKIEEITRAVKSGGRICLMCSEHKHPERCHRQQILMPAFAKRGIEIIELSDFYEI